ncbi:uncharacterized protein TRIVIDRAFT_64274 [Trichoderma virens Gv29-8]|uniref:Uncharacterized protein n=1 Tax=Hypocrea virens (strain Gv29-8 / FGSC 10586) TaxID=413071 RepID=G9MQK4_HYPVG|nr:uncharacterized protein TRIVIDRAFT_64274 [Trichoderma virens Gv29-8]EHK23272.1 hypothetical protein TRIVIDRAFT_64274 [Trichoderma virens Gv29-8]
MGLVVTGEAQEMQVLQVLLALTLRCTLRWIFNVIIVDLTFDIASRRYLCHSLSACALQSVSQAPNRTPGRSRRPRYSPSNWLQPSWHPTLAGWNPGSPSEEASFLVISISNPNPASLPPFVYYGLLPQNPATTTSPPSTPLAMRNPPPPAHRHPTSAQRLIGISSCPHPK